MNSVTEKKRADLLSYIDRHVISEPTVQGVVAIGSVATGLARANSDIDAVIFLDPLDFYAVPAEFYWQPETDTFHGIFSAVENVIQLDFKRLDLEEWSQPNYVWPEPICAELGEGWVAFDRTGQIEKLVTERTAFNDEIRQARLDETLIQLDQLLDISAAEQAWANLGSSYAHDRLHAAYDFLVQGIFAYNRRWRTWRSREMAYLFKLPWLPEGFEKQVLQASNALSSTFDGYEQRLNLLNQLFNKLVVQCQQDGLYGAEAIDEAFIRQHDEPGRDWNMAEWAEAHQQRKNRQ